MLFSRFVYLCKGFQIIVPTNMITFGWVLNFLSFLKTEHFPKEQTRISPLENLISKVNVTILWI